MVDKRAISRSYDALAETYAAHRPDNDRATELLEEVLDAESAPMRILDAGCGQGTPVLSRLTEAGPAVGLDISAAQLRLATERVRAASLVQGDMARLPFDRERFDLVVAFWSLIHVPLDEHQIVIDEFARVLEPDGRLLLCEGTNAWRGENPDWLESGVPMAWEIAGAESTASQLRTAGFTIEDRWGVPEILNPADEEEEDENAELPWTVFSARLDR